jgi:hypothetical protein
MHLKERDNRVLDARWWRRCRRRLLSVSALSLVVATQLRMRRSVNWYQTIELRSITVGLCRQYICASGYAKDSIAVLGVHADADAITKHKSSGLHLYSTSAIFVFLSRDWSALGSGTITFADRRCLKSRSYRRLISVASHPRFQASAEARLSW